MVRSASSYTGTLARVTVLPERFTAATKLKNWFDGARLLMASYQPDMISRRHSNEIYLPHHS